jgi:glyoxylase-like metal-dependent hydrolase (beta-lactamase superfamily II)
MATQLAAGLWHVDCSTLDRSNVFVVDDGDVTLVDAGWPGDEGTVRTGLADAGFGPSDVDRVLLTHYDADHVGTLARLTPGLDAPVFVHREDAPYVAGERLPPWTARNGVEALHRLFYRRMSLPDLPIRRVEGGDEIGGFRAHHTPGHTPGHVAYVHEELRAAFLGDLAYAVGDRLRPSGRFTSYDARQAGASIRTLADRVPELRYLCPGHGPPVEGGADRLRRAVE